MAAQVPDFQRLFAASPEVLLVLLPDAPRFTMVAATEARLAVTLTTREATMGRGLFDVFPDNPDDPAASGVSNLRASLERVLATKTPDTMAVQRYDIRGPDGSFRVKHWSPTNIPVLSDDGEVLYILHRVADVTALVQATEEGAALRNRRQEMEREIMARSLELEAANAELDRILAHSADIICTANAAGYFTRVNQAFSDILGWSREELLGRPFRDFVHPDDQAATLDAVERQVVQGERILQFENRYRRKDGTWRALSWKSVPQPGGVMYATARDVTQEREAAAAMRRQAEAVEQARLEAERANRAKDDFMSRVSHELRTPLNAILGFAQLFDADALTKEQVENVQQITAGGRHLLSLINDLLDVCRIEAGRLSMSPEAVDAWRAVQDAVELIKPMAAEHGIALAIPGPDPSMFVRADRQRLLQILLNLLANAVKYNRPHGRVTVTCEERPAKRFRISVADTGAGIPEAKLNLLFQPFERLGAEGTAIEGTGLGLALSRALSEAMNGQLGVTSVVDQGSTFWVELPLARAVDLPVVEGAAGAAPAAAPPLAAGSILYIEDNVSNVRLMQRMLNRRPDVKLVHAPNGPEGLALLRVLRPDLVLLDLHLPEMSGEEVLQRIWSDPDTRSTPVVVVTADATPALPKRLKAFGVAELLTKPLDVAQVLRVVDVMLSERRRGDEPV